jgi:GGDEF domain-containing protein
VEADPGLLGQLAASVSACRRSHRPVTLLLVELDDVEDLMITGGVEGFGRVRDCLETASRAVDHPSPICLPHGDMGFAVILPDCDRQRAARLANQLIEQFRRLVSGQSALSISLGAATVSVPSKNFPAEDLLHGAERCLYGSHASGGGVIKSIEIY